ncbi:GGDEF domain-containing protein [bacterium]|nr:GGDEF domain-containing protein [bacterium]
MYLNENAKTYKQLAAVASIYVSAKDIDVINNTFSKIQTCSTDALKHTECFANAQEMFLEAITRKTHPESLKTLKNFIDFSTFDKRFAKTDTEAVDVLNYENLWYRCRLTVSERTPDGRVSHIIWLVKQINEAKRKQDKLIRLSELDQMTGVNNRISGEHKIRNLINSGIGGMFMMLDADKFKSINDNFGHFAGDQVLIAIAKSMKQAFRNNDVLFRLGGDEFAAYAQGIYDKSNASVLINRLFERIDGIKIPELGARKITISVGAAFYSDEDVYPFEELYKNADNCVYLSKKYSDNYATFYNESV